MTIPQLALLISLLALILTKVADIVTTLRGIRRSGGSVQWEQNPLARKAMLRWGPLSGIAAVMVLCRLLSSPVTRLRFLLRLGIKSPPLSAVSQSPGASGMWLA